MHSVPRTFVPLCASAIRSHVRLLLTTADGASRLGLASQIAVQQLLGCSTAASEIHSDRNQVRKRPECRRATSPTQNGASGPPPSADHDARKIYVHRGGSHKTAFESESMAQ